MVAVTDQPTQQPTEQPIVIRVQCGSYTFNPCGDCGELDTLVVIQIHAVDEVTCEVWATSAYQVCISCRPEAMTPLNPSAPIAAFLGWELCLKVHENAMSCGRTIDWKASGLLSP